MLGPDSGFESGAEVSLRRLFLACCGESKRKVGLAGEKPGLAVYMTSDAGEKLAAQGLVGENRGEAGEYPGLVGENRGEAGDMLGLVGE